MPPHCILGDFHNGYYECDFVSPWTISAQNVDASLMLIGQDWVSSARLEKPPCPEQKRLGQIWSLPTNVNLRCLLRRHMDLCFCETYATNLFPFVKQGKMNQSISTVHLRHCAVKYAIPQIEIVRPRMVICLGSAVFNAIRQSLGMPRLKAASQVPEDSSRPGPTVIDGIEIYGAPHPGGLGVAVAGGMDEVHRLWSRLAARWKALIG